MTFFQRADAQDAVALLEEGPREARSPEVADLPSQLLGLQEDGAGEALRLVEFCYGSFALGAILGSVRALLRLPVLGLRPELPQIAPCSPRGAASARR